MSTPNTTCTFAGVKLPVWTAGGDATADRFIPLDEYEPFDGHDWYRHDLQHLPLPAPYAQKRCEPGTLRWPAGASRWAVAHFVVTASKLAEIRLALGSCAAADLVIDDKLANHGAVTASMHLLPPRPMFVGTPATADGALWLMTLVDDRFYWWQSPLSIDSTPASWSALFGAIGTALGVSIGGDSADAAYGSPTERWLCSNVPAPLVLDAAAESVGLRLVRRLDGTVRLENPATAKTAHDAQYTTFTTATATTGSYMAGGRQNAADIGRSLPGTLRVVFGRKLNGDVATGQFSYDVALNSLTVSGDFGVSTYCDRKARFTADQYGTWSGTTVAGDPSNLSTLTGMARRAAADWYSWRRGDTDIVWPGAVPWVPEGYADQLRWKLRADQFTTRFVRDPLFDPSVYGYYPAPAPSAGTSTDDGSFLAMLVGKCYVDQTGGISAASANCLPDGNCDGLEGRPARYKQYSWIRLDDSGTDPGPPCPVTWAEQGPAVPGVTCGGPGCFPAYHTRDYDHPIWAGGADLSCCGPGSTGGDNDMRTGSVQNTAIVRLRRGAGDYFLFSDDPWSELFRRTGETDEFGEQAFERTYDQETAAWIDGREVRLVSAG